MLRHVLVIATLLLNAALAQSAPPNPQAPSQTDEDIARIVGYSLTRGGALNFLETLTDTIGGRITGSPGSRAAATAAIMRSEPIAIRRSASENAIGCSSSAPLA